MLAFLLLSFVGCTLTFIGALGFAAGGPMPGIDPSEGQGAQDRNLPGQQD